MIHHDPTTPGPVTRLLLNPTVILAAVIVVGTVLMWMRGV